MTQQDTFIGKASGIHDDLDDAIKSATQAASRDDRPITIWRLEDCYGWSNHGEWGTIWTHPIELPRPVVTIDPDGTQHY